MNNDYLSNKRLIHSNDVLKFGKYYRETLDQVCEKDPEYLGWLVCNVNDINVYELNNINYWVNVYEGINDIVPRDGLYVLAIRSDNHMEYDLMSLKKGTNFNEFYGLDSPYNLKWENCIAYYYVQEYASTNKRWKYDIIGGKYSEPSIWAVREGTDEIKYYWSSVVFPCPDEYGGTVYCEFKMNGNGKIVLVESFYGLISIENGKEVDLDIEFLGDFFIGEFYGGLHRNHNDYILLLSEEQDKREK